MRVRTDERRRAIMAAAAEIFRRSGYERASMAAIAAQVGGSKTTLYSYFASKEELFATVMVDALDDQANQMLALLSPGGGDLRQRLERFGHAYLDLVLSPEVLALTRTGMADGAQGKLGPLLYAAGPRRGWSEIAGHLARWADEGRLAPGDPVVAALHLKALLEAGTLEAMLFGAAPVLDRDRAVASAVDIFLRAYGVTG